jgi:hypothetical protein
VASYAAVLRAYMEALGRSDYAAITELFSSEGRVRSPFLGEMDAGPFFERLGAASEVNVITPIDIFVSNSGAEHAVAYFRYDWTVRDGSVITFTVMDYFRFEPGTDKIAWLDLIYDTHPIRMRHGNKYESPL